MRNLTITVNDNVLEWARVEAARRGSSVSRMVGDFLGEMQRREDAYERAYLAWRTDERSWRAQGPGLPDSKAAVLPSTAVAAAALAVAAAPRSICFAREPASALNGADTGLPGAELVLSREQPVFVDTSVLVSAEDTSSPALYGPSLECLDHLWRGRAGRVSAQVLAEFYESVTGRRQHPMSHGDARAAIRRYNSWTPWQLDPATQETAWALQTRHQLSWGDCLALAAAQHSGCTAMLSLQLPHGAQFGGVQVWNPQRCLWSVQ